MKIAQTNKHSVTTDSDDVSDSTDFPEPENNNELPVSMRDPAVVAAKHMLRLIPPEQIAKLGRWDMIILVSPSAAWCDQISRAAPRIILRPVYQRTCKSTLRRPSDEDLNVSQYVQAEQLDKRDKERLIESIARDVRVAKSIIICTSDAQANLPAQIVKAADHQLIVPKLDYACLTEVISEVTAKPVNRKLVRQLSIDKITPEALRLAARKGQSSAAFIARLESIIGEPSRLLKNPLLCGF